MVPGTVAPAPTRERLSGDGAFHAAPGARAGGVDRARRRKGLVVGTASTRLPAYSGPTPAYCATGLDREPLRRQDPQWLAGTLASGAAEVRPFWQDAWLVSGTGRRPVVLSGPRAVEVSRAADQTVFLGRDGNRFVVAADLSALSEDEALRTADATATADLRAILSRPTPPCSPTVAGCCCGTGSSATAGHAGRER